MNYFVILLNRRCYNFLRIFTSTCYKGSVAAELRRCALASKYSLYLTVDCTFCKLYKLLDIFFLYYIYLPLLSIYFNNCSINRLFSCLIIHKENILA